MAGGGFHDDTTAIELKIEESETGILYADPQITCNGLSLYGGRLAKRNGANRHPRIACPLQYPCYRLAVPDDIDMVSAKSIPLEYGMDELHGVDFSKAVSQDKKPLRTKTEPPYAAVCYPSP